MTKISTQRRPHSPKLSDEEDDEFEAADRYIYDGFGDEFEGRQFDAGLNNSGSITFRISAEDKILVEEAAYVSGMSVSEWCRTRIKEIAETELFWW